MDRPPDISLPGTEVMHVTCRGCGRVVHYIGEINDLVGKQGRLKCACGHRGASLLRVWHQGAAPADAKAWKRQV